MRYAPAQDHPRDRHLSAADREFLTELVHCLEGGSHKDGIASIRRRLADPLPSKRTARAELLSTCACRLIDFSSESADDQAAEEGVKILRNHENLLRGQFDPGMYEYSLANGLNALYTIASRADPSYTLASIPLLTESKDWMWRAYRLQWEQRIELPEHLINLGSALDGCSRSAEALYWYDQALTIDPHHGMAHGNRALSLLTWIDLTDQHSVCLLAQARRGFVVALASDAIPRTARDLWRQRLEYVEAWLSDLGQADLDRLCDEVEQSRRVVSHSRFRQFCVEHGVTLSEHSAFRHCVCGSTDDLSIARWSAPIGGEFVPRMELILNRLKSEFAFARCLVYQSYPTTYGRWRTENYESSFSDLLDGEASGIKSEMIRTGFRLCFGILDRIAHGVCDLLNVADPGEQTYFHTFWRPVKPTTQKQRVRWETLNRECTSSLVALYSQATDLTVKGGQWAHLREWRNKLEHELLFLTDDAKDLGPLQARSGSKALLQIPLSDFRVETLHLLRFTGSAIVNFALFVRQKALEQERLPGRLSFEFRPKERKQSRRRAVLPRHD